MTREAKPPVLITGISASSGFALGPAFTLDLRRGLQIPRERLANWEAVAREQERLRAAIDRSDEQLAAIRSGVADRTEHALILEAHRMMLRDPMLGAAAERLVDEDRINAEWALRKVVRHLRARFDQLSDPYFRERRADLGYVADRVMRNLMGEKADLDEGELPKGAIVIARDLSPADAALLLRKGSVAGFVTELGGHTSHLAIVARAREIPAVVGAERATEIVHRGDLVSLDGDTGTALVHPTPEQIAAAKRALARRREAEAAMRALRDLPTVSTDQVHISLLANIEFAEEVPSLLAHGAEGIGLYRTEFLYLERADAPTEEEHYRTYRAVLEAMGNRPVTIRTLDLGADKAPRTGLARRREREPNPALGLRATRWCLKHRDHFMVQLRGLLRASVHGRLQLMFPLISSLTELREAKAMVARAQEELARDGYPFEPNVPIGIMVETPAAAWAADRLAQESDFFSIGTNDLIQYTLAVDRQNRDVAYLYKPLHISILRSIKHVVDAGRQAGIPVSLCGEMAGDPLYAVLFLGMGLDELSMVPSQIPVIKQLIRRASSEDGRELAEQAFKLHTAEEIERSLRFEMRARFEIGA